MESRKYYLDWLRVLAFLFLVLFHVGMLYVSWRYNLKSPRLVPEAELPMSALIRNAHGIPEWKLFVEK